MELDFPSNILNYFYTLSLIPTESHKIPCSGFGGVALTNCSRLVKILTSRV